MTIQVRQLKDNSYELQWDKQDPEWKFLNHLTSKELQIIIEQAIREDTMNK
jgi:hypothetical protein